MSRDGGGVAVPSTVVPPFWATRAGAGHAVGYASASQFNREYRRMFGAPPGQDAARLQDSRLVAE
jgi:hypothetical protein